VRVMHTGEMQSCTQRDAQHFTVLPSPHRSRSLPRARSITTVESSSSSTIAAAIERQSGRRITLFGKLRLRWRAPQPGADRIRAQLHDQLTQDDDDLGHLGTGGVIGAPAAGEQRSELRREALWDWWPLAL
jgi:hypothetical protein